MDETLLAAITDAAAHEWLTLCAALGLDLQATAQGVVTEIRNLRAELAAQTAEGPT